jgi:phytoene dehydrogenase-like protein
LRTVPPSKQDVVDLFASHSLDRLSKAIFETSWADLVAPIVTSDRYRAAMTYETYGDPWARGSVFMTAYMGTAITNNKKGRWGRAMGGMGSVTQALAGAAEAAGVRIHTNTAVLSILVEQGTACGVVAGGARIMFDAVVCGCNPRTMEELLPSSYRTDISRNAEQPSFAGAKLHLALNRLPRVAVALDPDLVYRSGTIAIIPDLPQMRASYRPGSTRAPQREFVLSGYVPSYYDESLAPSGKHILSFDIHAVGFGEDREQLLSQLMAYIAISFPDIASCTDDALLLLPEDIAGRYGSSLCHHWNVSGPLMDERPAPGYSGARTPTPGLYLCGSGAYPGGFVSGIPGWNCARTIIDSTSKRET